MDKWWVKAHRDVMKKDVHLLEQQNLKSDFDEIVENLKKNPFKQYRIFKN